MPGQRTNRITMHFQRSCITDVILCAVQRNIFPSKYHNSAVLLFCISTLAKASSAAGPQKSSFHFMKNFDAFNLHFCCYLWASFPDCEPRLQQNICYDVSKWHLVKFPTLEKLPVDFGLSNVWPHHVRWHFRKKLWKTGRNPLGRFVIQPDPAR